MSSARPIKPSNALNEAKIAARRPHASVATVARQRGKRRPGKTGTGPFVRSPEGGSEKEEETKLGVHSCRSDLPADNCVAFPQMASGDVRGRIVGPDGEKCEMHNFMRHA